MIRGFTFWRSYYEALNKLNKEDKYKCLENMLDYVFSGIIPEDQGAPAVIFDLMKPYLDKSIRNGKNGAKTYEIETKSKQNQNIIETKSKNEVDFNSIAFRPYKEEKEEEKEKEKEEEEEDAPALEDTPAAPVKSYGLYNNVLLTPEQYEYIKAHVLNYEKRIDKTSQGIKENWKGYTANGDHYNLIIKYAMTDNEFIKNPVQASEPPKPKTISENDYKALVIQAERENLEERDVKNAMIDSNISFGEQTSSGAKEEIQYQLKCLNAF